MKLFTVVHPHNEPDVIFVSNDNRFRLGDATVDLEEPALILPGKTPQLCRSFAFRIVNDGQSIFGKSPECLLVEAIIVGRHYDREIDFSQCSHHGRRPFFVTNRFRDTIYQLLTLVVQLVKPRNPLQLITVLYQIGMLVP